MQRDKVWNDVVAGPCPDGGLFFFFLTPDRGLSNLRKLNTHSLTNRDGEKFQRSLSMPMSVGPVSPTTPTAARKDNARKGAFNAGSNLNIESVGAQFVDKPSRSSAPGVFEWLYNDNGDNKSKNI